MRNTQKGFAILLLIGIIVLLVISSGIYIYENKIAKKPISNNSPILKVSLNEEFSLNLGQEAEINNQNVKVKFNKVYPVGGGTGPIAFHYEPLFTLIIDNASYDQSQTKYRIRSTNNSLDKNTKNVRLVVMTIKDYCKSEPEPEAEYGCFQNAARGLRDTSYCYLITNIQRKSQCLDLIKDYVY